MASIATQCCVVGGGTAGMMLGLLQARAGVPDVTMGRFDLGRTFVQINRGAHWQCGYVIAKGSFEDPGAARAGPSRPRWSGCSPAFPSCGASPLG